MESFIHKPASGFRESSTKTKSGVWAPVCIKILVIQEVLSGVLQLGSEPRPTLSGVLLADEKLA